MPNIVDKTPYKVLLYNIKKHMRGFNRRFIVVEVIYVGIVGLYLKKERWAFANSKL